MHGEDHAQDEEVVDGELVEHPRATPARREPPPAQAPLTRPAHSNPGLVWARTPAAQHAMAAATGFVAGAATLALVRRYGSRGLERALNAAASEEPLLPPSAPLGAGRTYIVHVRPLHTLGPGNLGE